MDSLTQGETTRNLLVLHEEAVVSDRHQTSPYPLRMPPELRDNLKEAAKENRRSMNAEIVARLQQSFGEQTMRPMQDSDLDALLDLLQERDKKRKEE